MSKQSEVMQLLKHMDDEWPEDWDQDAIKAELLRLHVVNADLLQALINLLHAFPGEYTEAPAHITSARVAIAKATGDKK